MSEVNEATEVSSDETLERFVIEVDAALDRHANARLATIDARLARIEGFVTLCETLAAQIQESPMFAMLANSDSPAGFGAFFPS